MEKYFAESYVELMHKVSWPLWTTLQSSAILVMVASLVFALMIFGMDFVFQNGMEVIYKLLY
ncbi:MAG: preprotein translocase subunit SecE [Bacteroidales bacterium]